MTMDTRLHKGLLTTLRRAPKVAAPVVRHGVTRAGQVGVEFEHQGVKAWGRNETAARASWQVSNVGKRYQDGSGTAVGRRHVEKAAATATPARRPAQQMAKTGAQQSRRALVRSNAMPSIEAAPEPVTTAEQPVAKRKQRPAGSRPGDLADFARRNPSGALAATGAGMVIGGAAAVPLMPLARRAGRNLRHYRNARSVVKADRYFDPEDKRQRRLGAYGAGAALVGADQVRRGAQSTSRASRSLTGAKTIGEYLAGHDVKSRGDQKALVVLAHNTERGAMLVNPRAAARIAGGAALIAGAGAVVRRGGDPRRRRWQ